MSLWPAAANFPAVDLAAHFFACGIWPALPLIGRALLSRESALRDLPVLARLAIYPAWGIAICSLPMLLLAAFGIFHPAEIGAVGWLLCLAFAFSQRKKIAPSFRAFPREMHRADWLFLAGFGAICFFYFAFPTDSIFGGFDQGVYENHAIHLARTGRLDLPYPVADPALRDALHLPEGLYPTQPTITVQFLHLLPVWLAQSFACGGEKMLVRFLALIGALDALLIFGLLGTLVPKRFAAIGALFFALSPAQLWNARITLSEILAQMFIWAALLLFTLSLQKRRRLPAALAGWMLGMGCIAHIDVFLVWPCLFFADLLTRIFEKEASRREWLAFYLGGVFATLFALFYNARWSAVYVENVQEFSPLLCGLAICFLFNFAAPKRVTAALRPVFLSRHFCIIVGALAALTFIYCCWVLPNATDFHLPKVSDYRASTLRNFAAYISLPIALSALAGWIVLFWKMTRGGAVTTHISWLVVGTGFAVLYLWNPHIDPRHFWASRRYIPAMLPVFTISAAVGANWLFNKCRGSTKPLAEILFAAYLCIFLWRSDRLILCFREKHGAFAAVHAIADAVPRDCPLMIDAPARNLWTLPLELAFGRAAFVFNESAQDRQAITRLFPRDSPIYFLTNDEPSMPRFDAELIATFHPNWRETESVRHPSPARIVESDETLQLYRLDAFHRELELLNQNLLAIWDPEVTLRGFYAVENLPDEPGETWRWTDARAMIQVPMPNAREQSALEIEVIGGSPASDQPLQIALNGQTVFNGPMPFVPWRRAFPLNTVDPSASVLQIRFTTTTFVPAQLDPAADDRRSLGLQIRAVRIVGIGASADRDHDE